jgi:hypothetical protein
VGLDVYEPMGLELGQPCRDVLDEILVKNILARCRLPALIHPARKPGGQAVDGILRVRIHHEVAISFSAVLQTLNS